MAAASIITVSGLGKRYDLSRERRSSTLREAVTGLLKFGAGRAGAGSGVGAAQHAEFWALRDVSFAVAPGEILGVLGRNGAGKSTLLKIISRITRPTEGSVEIRGRVGSLLEVGTGFHPELTGRENIFMSGAVLGMKRDEISRKFDSIVEFSEIGQFLDLPVKRYSSGMYVRLAFSVVAHLDPEILIVDEVLGVGDAIFQKKCLDKLRDIVRGGSTIMLVSHNINAVMSLCTRAVLLDRGTVVSSGDVFDCVNRYSRAVDRPARQAWTGDLGDESLRLHAVRIVSESGHDVFMRGDTFWLEIDYEVRTGQNAFVVVGADFCNTTGVFLCASRLTDSSQHLACAQQCGRHLARLRVDTSLFSEGEFRVKVNLGLHNIKRVIDDEPLLSFTVVNPQRNYDHETLAYRNIVYPDWAWDLE
jgi:lipopolysaccharide transport system ATP-binding protein